MKAIKILSHPFVLVICFLMILISGQHLGGFYLLYILLGLSHGAIHSLLAIAGVGVLLFSNYKYKRAFVYLIEPILNISGVILLSLSLFLFFYNDKQQYNYSTLYQTVPLITIAIFVMSVATFVSINLKKLQRTVTG
ncbi:MAG: hypothetical protein ABIN01_01275 [Ferruginibacter sp.]